MYMHIVCMIECLPIVQIYKAKGIKHEHTGIYTFHVTYRSHIRNIYQCLQRIFVTYNRVGRCRCP